MSTLVPSCPKPTTPPPSSPRRYRVWTDEKLLPRRADRPRRAVRDRHPPAERDGRAAPRPRAEQHAPGHPHPLAPHGAATTPCWLPGTDHAGIATQTVVEKRVLAEERARRTRRSFAAASEFVAKIQAWKDEYEQQITDQLKAMGCSCDWDRQAFTMDEPRAKAVREAFFQLFKDGLIYRGKRLVNWDPVDADRAGRRRSGDGGSGRALLLPEVPARPTAPAT